MKVPGENKADRFCRIAEARVNKIIKMVRLLGNCSTTSNYEYTRVQVDYIFSALQSELDKAKKRYLNPVPSGKVRFSLSEPYEPDREPEWFPAIVLELPDGTYLRAVAIDDENFPAINIHWDRGKGESSEAICFAEFNPERDEGPQVCVGVYQSDEEDTKYYALYMAERKCNED